MAQPGYTVISADDIDYEQGEIISPKGSHNAVYKAIWKSPAGPQQVAVKSCNQFKEEEVKTLAALQHKNIITFYGVVKRKVPPDEYVMVTEYAEKGSLCNVIDQNRDNWSVYRQRVWMKWAREGAEGLDFIHQKGYQHGDVKSPNVLITSDDTMKICDFGTARKHMYTVTTYSVRAGSFPWMAPEAMGFLHDQDKNPKLTTKADVFSFAVVLWELITGQVPFPGQTQLEIYKTVAEKKEHLEIPQGCPKHLSDFLRQCWAPDYRQRPNLEDVLKHLVDPERDMDKPEMTDLFLLGISKKTSTDWKQLAYNLGFQRADVDAYQANNIGDVVQQCHTMLIDWKRKQDSEEEARHVLREALINMGRNDLAREV